MLTVEVESYPAAGEFLVFIRSNYARDRMLIGAVTSLESAEEIGKALARSLGATFSGVSDTCAVPDRA